MQGVRDDYQEGEVETAASDEMKVFQNSVPTLKVGVPLCTPVRAALGLLSPGVGYQIAPLQPSERLWDFLFFQSGYSLNLNLTGA